MSAAKSEAVFAIFSIVKDAVSPMHNSSKLEVNIGLEIEALLSVLPLLTHPFSSTYSA